MSQRGILALVARKDILSHDDRRETGHTVQIRCRVAADSSDRSISCMNLRAFRVSRRASYRDPPLNKLRNAVTKQLGNFVSFPRSSMNFCSADMHARRPDRRTLAPRRCLGRSAATIPSRCLCRAMLSRDRAKFGQRSAS